VSSFLHLFAVTLYPDACGAEEVLRARIIDAQFDIDECSELYKAVF
jgi:hypothetical protein